MNIKHLFSSMAILAAVGVVTSVAHAQNYQVQQGRIIQGNMIQGNMIQGNMIQGRVIQGQMNQGQMIQQTPNYSNVTMTEAQRGQTNIGATLTDAGSSLSVRSIFTNGPAQTAGLTSGDMITKVNGQAVQGVSAFNAVVAGMKSGDSLKLTKRSNDGKESEVELKVMTMGEIIKASTVPEAGAYDGVVRQAEISISGLKQQIKNTQDDLKDLEARLAAQEKNLAAMKVKAETAAKEAVKLKAQEDAKRAAQLEKLKKEREAAAEAQADAAVQRSK